MAMSLMNPDISPFRTQPFQLNTTTFQELDTRTLSLLP